ncbi:aspartyl-tRNA synthetase [Alkalihalobacterium chitinilyticum]|uniref:Aspartyl-tRNA synthetase n=1 Tax=Alkalihalobacterium chitinilyticum TaxID=2980103 RepID=A0ABT5VIK5_9BACI|nr:aspartyl-tRNA synthetase [Alkalihalobacterium chitinilyticum]MDE5415254.1 aspartyl-tRNA synthetase [Alkalihalobacterium chitinilyticum]
MNKKQMMFMIGLFVIAIVIGGFMYDEYQQSYPEPQQALFATDPNLILIPAYKIGNEALFFLFKEGKHLGAAQLKKGLLGWKPPMITYSPLGDVDAYDKLSGYQGYGGHLIYGLIPDGTRYEVIVEEEPAGLLPLAMLPEDEVEELGLEGFYLWYYESGDTIRGGTIYLRDLNTGKIVDEYTISK